jgi:hypothetical protein
MSPALHGTNYCLTLNLWGMLQVALLNCKWKFCIPHCLGCIRTAQWTGFQHSVLMSAHGLACPSGPTYWPSQGSLRLSAWVSGYGGSPYLCNDVSSNLEVSSVLVTLVHINCISRFSYRFASIFFLKETFLHIVKKTIEHSKSKIFPVLNQLSTTSWRRMGEWIYRSKFSWLWH